MQILLIAATSEEVRPYITTHTGTDVLITGVGVPSTIYHLQERLQQLDYDLVIQAGIGGSFTDKICPGRVILIKQDIFGDLGMEEKENFKTIFEEGFADGNEFPFEKSWLVNRHEIFQTSSLAAVKAVTVNKVTDNTLQKQQLLNKFSPQVESMEGAALHYVCLQEKIPFLQVRAISNYVGERDKTKWKMKEAIINLNAELEKLIKQLIK